MKDRRLFALLAAVALMLVLYALPAPRPLERAGNLIPLTPHGQACLAIMAFAVTLWVTEAVPFAVTSLLVVLLIPAFGIADYRVVVRSGFGDPVITFFIGVLILSAAFTRSGLGTRLVYHVLLRVGTRTDRVLLGFLIVGVLISMWITKMAVAAMLLPIGLAILRDAGAKPLQSNFGRTIMIAVAFGPLIGGIATPAGTAANLVAIAQLKQLAHTDVSFARWMLYGLPACILMVPVAWRLLLWMFPPEIDRLPVTLDEIRARLSTLGAPSANEKRTVAVFATAIAAWILAPFVDSWTGGRVAVSPEAIGLAAGLCVLLPGLRVLTWKEAEHDIDWGGIMLIVAGLSLGTVVFDSGAARWLAWVLLGRVSSVPQLLRPFVIVLGVGVLRLMFSSNTVAASIITPILVALAADLHLDAWTIVAPAAFSATLGFILVSQGPTTIIPYGAGYFSIKDMAKAGVLMTIAAALCIAVAIGAVNALSPSVLSAAAPPADGQRCEELASRSAAGIQIVSAQTVAAGALQRFTNLPALCRVEATLKPSADSDIKIEVWLPVDTWNGRLQAVGNRGWGGSIMLPALANAVANGYAAVSTDTGHAGGGARFALGHPEKLVDAGYRAVHEATGAAKALVEAYYGRAPRFSYWNGCSLGGRQGLTEAQRYPADYDGIVVGDAAYDVPALYTGRIAIAQAAHRTAANEIAPAALPLIHKAALDACDARDGVADGVIENPRQCRFDPAVLRCGDSAAPGDATCLTPLQVETVRAIYAPITDPRTGAVLFPGLEPGSELGWGVVAGAQPENNSLDLFKYVVFNDADWNWQTFTLAGALDAIARTPHIDAINAVDPGLRPYFARGGKLLMYHGWADPQTPPQNSIRYYNRVRETVGDKDASSSLRLFMVPGMGHCEGGDGTDTFDAVAALANWVERGETPTHIDAARLRDGKLDRTRPLCAYPNAARWTGRGNSNDAANFACTAA